MAERKKDYGKPTITSSMSEVWRDLTEEERDAEWNRIFGKKEPKDCQNNGNNNRQDNSN